ncbi:MAG TPA: hypothetical protein DE179_09650 [Oceanospirillaceae bacterium]|nr:hypothetical protein [Oceanospirillaceae bacterium]
MESGLGKHIEQLDQASIRSLIFKSKLILGAAGLALVVNGYTMFAGESRWSTLLVVVILLGLVGQHGLKLRALYGQLSRTID